MTITPAPGQSPIYPVPRSAAERAALRTLLIAAKRVETVATGPTRREAFRTTRSLIGAARILGFTLTELAEILSVTEGSARARSGPIVPMLPSTFLALTGDQPPTGVLGPDGTERAVDPVGLVVWYLDAAFVANGHPER